MSESSALIKPILSKLFDIMILWFIHNLPIDTLKIIRHFLLYETIQMLPKKYNLWEAGDSAQ